MKAVVAAFNQEKALVGAFSVITNLRMELFEALAATVSGVDVVVVTEEGRNYEVWTKQTSVQSGSVSADYPPVVDSRGV